MKSTTNNYLKVVGRAPVDARFFFFDDRDALSRNRAWADALAHAGRDNPERIAVWRRPSALGAMPADIRGIA